MQTGPRAFGRTPTGPRENAGDFGGPPLVAWWRTINRHRDGWSAGRWSVPPRMRRRATWHRVRPLFRHAPAIGEHTPSRSRSDTERPRRWSLLRRFRLVTLLDRQGPQLLDELLDCRAPFQSHEPGTELELDRSPLVGL